MSASMICHGVVSNTGKMIVNSDSPLAYVKEDILTVFSDLFLTHYIIPVEFTIRNEGYGKKLFEIMVDDNYFSGNAEFRPFLCVLSFCKSHRMMKDNHIGLSCDVEGSIIHANKFNWYREHKIINEFSLYKMAKLNKWLIKTEMAKFTIPQDKYIDKLLDVMRRYKYGKYAEMIWRLNCLIELYENPECSIRDILEGPEIAVID